MTRQYQSFWEDSVVRVPDDLKCDLSPASPQGPEGLKGLSPARPKGTWGAERTESRQSPGYLEP